MHTRLPHVGLTHAAGSLRGSCEAPDLCRDELQHAISLCTLSCQIAALTTPGAPVWCCPCRASCTSLCSCQRQAVCCNAASRCLLD